MDFNAKRKQKRCDMDMCRKKLPLIPNICSCGLHLCDNHKPISEHDCPYDYNGDHRIRLEQNAVKFSKIDSFSH